MNKIRINGEHPLEGQSRTKLAVKCRKKVERLEGEPVKAEHNPSTKPQHPRSENDG